MKFSEIKRLLGLCCYEDELSIMGYDLIAGVDEVGRGSLAGPLVAAAVIMDRKNFMIEDIDDSKKLNPLKRLRLYKKITESCICWSVAKISPAEIDRQNITIANIRAIDLAASNLKIKPDIIISDFININSKKLASISFTGFIPITKGDEHCISIAAASIIAKVTRDRIMEEMALSFPEYGFDKNKGYGTKKHMMSIREHGPTGIHRMTFRGVLDS